MSFDGIILFLYSAISFTAEPTSLNPTNKKAHEENFVVASGTKNWNDVINDWKAVINGLNEPHAYVCEKCM